MRFSTVNINYVKSTRGIRNFRGKERRSPVRGMFSRFVVKVEKLIRNVPLLLLLRPENFRFICIFAKE